MVAHVHIHMHVHVHIQVHMLWTDKQLRQFYLSDRFKASQMVLNCPAGLLLCYLDQFETSALICLGVADYELKRSTCAGAVLNIPEWL